MSPREFDRSRTETLLRAMLADEGITEPQTWVVETILEYEEAEGEIPNEQFDYQTHQKMFAMMYQLVLDKLHLDEEGGET